MKSGLEQLTKAELLNAYRRLAEDFDTVKDRNDEQRHALEDRNAKIAKMSRAIETQQKEKAAANYLAEQYKHQRDVLVGFIEAGRRSAPVTPDSYTYLDRFLEHNTKEPAPYLYPPDAVLFERHAGAWRSA